MRAGNYAMHAVRDWLFLKLKPRFTHKRAGNYEIHAVRDWLFL